MDFGRVPADQLSQVDFRFASDPPFTQALLNGGRVTSPRLLFGAPRWTVPDWVGSLFPRKTKPAGFLPTYASQFNAVELNATHYKIYDATELERWANMVNDTEVGQSPHTFYFCPKLFQGISHRGSLKGKEDLLQLFVSNIKVLDTVGRSKLGPVFIQLSDQFSPARQVELLEFLSSLPPEINWMLELRHPDWFKLTTRMDQFYQTLRALKIGLVITDVAGRRDVCHFLLTVPSVMVRFIGNQLHSTDFTRIDAWAERLHQWFNTGLETAWFFLHMGDERTVPPMAVYAARKLSMVTGIDCAIPQLEDEEPSQGSLF